MAEILFGKEARLLRQRNVELAAQIGQEQIENANLQRENERLKTELQQRNLVIAELYQEQAVYWFERDMYKNVVESMYLETPDGWTWATGPDTQAAWEAYVLWRNRQNGAPNSKG